MNIKKTLILTCIICLLIMSYVSQDQYHLDNCHEENCRVCIMIQIAKVIVNNMLATVMITTVLFLIYYILSKIKKLKIVCLKNTLIYRKVQLNE